MKLSTKARYGLRAMLELGSSYEKEPLILREVAERQEIPIKYLEQLIIPLKIGNLVRNTRGAGKGYSLTRPPEMITLREIITALEGPLIDIHCSSDWELCDRRGECVMAEFWNEFQHTVDEYLGSKTLKELVDKQGELTGQEEGGKKKGKVRKKILIIEDDKMLVETMRMILESNYYQTFAAYDGKEGLKLAREHKPDLILLDVMMGTDTEGFQVAYALRRDPELKDIPILMITAINQEEPYFNYNPETDKEQFPVNKLLDKPVSPDKLLSEVAKFFENEKNQSRDYAGFGPGD